MHLLITGGAGFIGSNLARLALEQGHRVTVIDDLSTGFEENLAGQIRAGSGERAQDFVETRPGLLADQNVPLRVAPSGAWPVSGKLGKSCRCAVASGSGAFSFFLRCRIKSAPAVPSAATPTPSVT